ncbi:MAG TPA: GNAT family N-acyltransferase, partial [Vicinamibacterales bacterium]|nr:GNAT family N-acyltransferase [Vicinamibacterales bacterium]
QMVALSASPATCCRVCGVSGAPTRTLTPQTLQQVADDAESATIWLRDRVYALRGGATPIRTPSPIASAVNPHAMEMEIAALPPDAHLLASGDLDVYCTEAAQMPSVLEEIGRLREVTFRAVGEGTGNPTDVDRFDRHYLHLFVWNRARREIAGAYRIGRTDVIVAQHGIKGLYTSTLFRFDARLISALSPALELGRSFVRAEYQRHSNALLLLWKAIGRFVVRSSRYAVLFGAVSISRHYADTSRQLMLAFLQQHREDVRLARLVSPLHPPQRMPLPAHLAAQPLQDAAAADALVARIQADGQGMPVLLRQYLRLDARLLGFNVDPQFGDALDALMAVDLRRVEPAILRRYLGRDGAAIFSRSDAAAA